MQHHYTGHWKGWALKIETFLGPEKATREASAIWAHLHRFASCEPAQCPGVQQLACRQVYHQVKMLEKIAKSTLAKRKVQTNFWPAKRISNCFSPQHGIAWPPGLTNGGLVGSAADE